MDMSLSKLRELVMYREAFVLQFMRSQRVGHDWATELNWLSDWTELKDSQWRKVTRLKTPPVLPTVLCKMKNSLTRRKKMDHMVDYTQLPASPSLWPISRIPCPSHLRDNYFKQHWRRTGPLKAVDFHIYACIYLLFSWVSAVAHWSDCCPFSLR